MTSAFNLSDYMNDSITNIVGGAYKASLKNPREALFITQYMLAAGAAKKKRAAYEQQGTHIPPFLIASITSKCNLFCAGCYARANHACGENLPDSSLSAEKWGGIFREARELGVSFILLAGGEPFMRRDVIEEAAAVKDIVFPVFTNGTMLDAAYIKLFDKNRNLIPIISLEGNEVQTNTRRGGGTYATLMQAMQELQSKGIYYGVSVTVTTENLNTVVGEGFIGDLYSKGCKLVFYVEYVPVTPETKQLAPGERERLLLDKAKANFHSIYDDMIILAFPGDEKYTGGCLAAGRGFFHINVNGGAEPCPFSPFSDTSLHTCTLLEALDSPLFQKLNSTGMLLGEHTGGCTLFEKEAEVREFLQQ